MVDIGSSLLVLEKVLEVVGSESRSEEPLLDVMNQLTVIVKSSITDLELRHEMAHSHHIWRMIKVDLEQEPEEVNLELKFRLIRGVVLLARNLLSVARDIALEIGIRQAIFKFGLNLQKIEENEGIYNNCLVSAFQCLSNLTVNRKDHEPEVLYELVAVFKSIKIWNEDTQLPVFSYFKNIMDSPDFLHFALSKGEGKPILKELLIQFEKLDLEGELSSFGILIVSIFTKLIVHESFLKFITVYNDPDYTIRYLKVAQTIITSKESWEVFELTVILSWVYELFQKTVPQIQSYFETNSQDEPLFIYQKASSSLDILATLSKYDHSRKFLLSYEGVQNLVGLLGIIQKNVKPKKLKDDQKLEAEKDSKIEYKNFPHIKSFIIEILSSLVYQNFDVQELMRELHGLELVLSNCIIDDNEPFIKERSIVCLRFLLLNNEKNQEFVSKLEAKQAVQDDTLDEAGFEVEIVDGKVKLKQKPNYKP